VFHLVVLAIDKGFAPLYASLHRSQMRQALVKDAGYGNKWCPAAAPRVALRPGTICGFSVDL
jgi:hypothetical protein